MNATHKPIKVLLIEDDPEYAYLLQEMLATAGDAPFDLEHVDRLSVGVERLASGGIDVILLDLLLPDGRELDTFTRVHTQAPDVPIIVMSCLGDETLTVEVVREGAQDYLVKGQVDANSLARAIRYAIERKRAEEVLREQKDRAQKRLDIAGAMIVAIDIDQTITLVNKRSCEVLGYRDVEIVGKNWFDTFIPERIRDQVRNVFMKLMAGEIEPVEHFENPVLTRDGEERIIAWRHTVLRDENGDITNTLSSGEDITERKRAEETLRKAHDELERRVEERTAELTAANRRLQREVAERKRAEEALQESEEKLKAQYKGIPVPTYTWQRIGEDFVLINYNDAAEAITHGHIVDFVSRTAGQMYQGLPEILKDLQRCMVEQISIKREMPYRFQSTDEQKHLAVTYAFVPPDLVMVHTEDVTERKRAEEALQEAHDELELGIAERTTELTAANRMLQREITERKRAEQLLRALNQASLVMEKVLTPEEIFSTVAEELKRLGFSCVVFLTDESQSKLFPKYLSYGAGPIEVAEKLMGLKAETFSVPVETVDIYRQGVWEKQTVFVEDATGPTRQMLPGPLKKLAGQMVKILRVPKAINSPLIVEDKVIGLLSVQSDDLTEDDVPVITAFAHQTAAAWHRARLFEQAQQEITERKRAEEQLRESEKRYRTLYESSRDGIVAANLDGRIVECNRAYGEMLGYSRRELAKSKYQDITPVKWQTLDENVFKEILEQGFSNEFEKEYIRKDGTIFPVSLRAWRIDDETGSPIGVWAIVRDITGRKRAEEALQRQLEESVVLHAIATAGAEATDEDTLITHAAQVIDKIFYLDHLEVLLLDKATGTLHVHPSCQGGEKGRRTTIPPGHGIVGQVAADGQPRRISDVTGKSECQTADSRVRSALCVPMKAGGQVLGAINVESVHQDAFSEADERLLTTFAGQMATAIEKVRLMETLEQQVVDRTKELAVLYDVTAATSEFLDLEATLERALKRTLAAMDSRRGTIQLLDEGEENLRLAVHQGIPPHAIPIMNTLPARDSAWSSWVLEHSEPLVVLDVAADPRTPVASPASFQLSYAGIPIRAGGLTLGVLSVFRERGQQFSAEELALLASLAGHVGVAVENARLQRRAEQAAVMEERERLARELHDSVIQLLYSLTLLAEGNRRMARSGTLENVEHCLADLGEIAQQALKEMRLLIFELRPSVLEREGLVGALYQRLEAVERRVGVEARLVAEGEGELPALVEEGLYRIAGEALNNALRHAASDSVRVHICVQDDRVELEVADDGVGFDPGKVIDKGGIGLAGMRHRAERIGGALTILSAPGEGTRVKATISL